MTAALSAERTAEVLQAAMSPREREVYRDFFRGKATTSEIARDLGTSNSSIAGCVYRMRQRYPEVNKLRPESSSHARAPGRTSNRLTPEAKALIAKLGDRDVPDREIVAAVARKCGVHLNIKTIARYRKPRSQGWSAQVAAVHEPRPPKPQRAATEPSRRSIVARTAYPPPEGYRGPTCKWPLWGDQERPTHQFCGGKAEPGLPYCRDHQALATRPPGQGAW